MGASVSLERHPFKDAISDMSKSQGLLREISRVIIKPNLDKMTPLARHFGAFHGRWYGHFYFMYDTVPLMLMARLCANVGLFAAPDHRIFILLDTDVQASNYTNFECLVAVTVRTRVFLRDQYIASVRLTFVNKEEEPNAPSSPLISCANCSAIYLNPLRKCSRCHTVRYCSKECQTQDWKNGHKFVCAIAAP
jgi:hypothetical protein